MEGAANEALLGFLAEAFAVARREVLLVLAGAQGRQKRGGSSGFYQRARAEETLRAWGLEPGALKS